MQHLLLTNVQTIYMRSRTFECIRVLTNHTRLAAHSPSNLIWEHFKVQLQTPKQTSLLHRVSSTRFVFHCQTMCLFFTCNASYVQGDDWVPDWGYNKVACLCIQFDAMLAGVFVSHSLHYCMGLLLSASIKALFD
jgi:hypothetical protein